MAKQRRPTYQISQITSLRRELRDYVLFEFYGANLDGHGLARMKQLLHRRLSGIPEQVLHDSLQHLVGQTLTEQILADTAWRLAGNWRRMQQGIAALPWTVQQGQEWVPVHVTAMQMLERRPTDRDQRLAFSLQVLAGSPCPRLITKSWSYKFCFMLGRRLGYTSRRGHRPMLDPAEIVNLRMLVLLDPEYCRDGQPGFDKIHCGGSLLKWNKRVIGKRHRIVDNKPWPCPQGFRWRCFQCHVGFDQCEAATHRMTIPAGPLQGTQHASSVPTA